jgi:hypothetical protein
VFRTLRVLRPLRVAAKSEGVRVVINSLLASLPAVRCLWRFATAPSLIQVFCGCACADGERGSAVQVTQPFLCRCQHFLISFSFVSSAAFSS